MNKTVKDLMVPLSEYATVSEDASLIEAIEALEKSQKSFDPNKHLHRAILVYHHSDKNKIIGKISQLDVLRALEPKYKEMGGDDPLSQVGLSRFGFSRPFLKSLISRFELWDDSLDKVCKQAAQQLKAKYFMYTPTEGEYVEETTCLKAAIHQLVMGHHQSLIVTSGHEIVGILRLTDVFSKVSELIKATLHDDGLKG